ncbi:MAG: GNAT family N-acetyltransferase [Chloroflexaceae bacterium]|nr:GNAT family N-acetyltransferase [Chloroflexaceae bacterium]
MRWFQHGLDVNQAVPRFSTRADLVAVARLLRDGARHYYGLNGKGLPTLLNDAHAVVLEGPHQELWAVALVDYAFQRTTWLRGVGLTRGIRVQAAIESLLPLLHKAAYERGVRRIFYTGDDTDDSWLLSSLRRYGYEHDTDVLVYEKRNLYRPSTGNQTVHIRPVRPQDEPAITMLDRACFEAHWTKEGTALELTMVQDACFMAAELGNQIVGYAYVSIHNQGKLLHLVRLAVDPRYRGQGIGVRLVAEVVALGQRYRTEVITLNTQSYNHEAQQIYRWFGFMKTGERQEVLRYDYGDDGNGDGSDDERRDGC